MSNPHSALPYRNTRTATTRKGHAASLSLQSELFVSTPKCEEL